MTIRSRIQNFLNPHKKLNLSSDTMYDLNHLGELYHDFSFFGAKNKQLPGCFHLNQCCKAPIIIAYIAYAIAKSKINTNSSVKFIELFCADGYYAMIASRLGATKSYGIDSGRDGYFERADQIAKILEIKNVEFIKSDVNKLDEIELDNVDIVANIGGLYHVKNPEELLIKSYNLAKNFLIVQSVVSMSNNDPEYFETPAPGWSWGCRYNKLSFNNMIQKLGFKIVDYHFNELTGNESMTDRGSVYYLIEK